MMKLKNTIRTLFMATLTGWAGVLVIDFFTFAILEPKTIILLLYGYVVIGLPVALFVCMLIGLVAIETMRLSNGLLRNNFIIFGFAFGIILGMLNTIMLKLDYLSAFVLLDVLSTGIVGALAGLVAFRTAEFEPANS